MFFTPIDCIAENVFKYGDSIESAQNVFAVKKIAMSNGVMDFHSFGDYGAPKFVGLDDVPLTHEPFLNHKDFEALRVKKDMLNQSYYEYVNTLLYRSPKDAIMTPVPKH